MVKIIVVQRCLEYLVKPLRNIVGDYLQYNNRVKFKKWLNIDTPELPLLTVEEMARKIRFTPQAWPNSNVVYIPHISRWILTIPMVRELIRIKKKIMFECPRCKEYHNLIKYNKGQISLKMQEITFMDASKSFSICEFDAQDIRQAYEDFSQERGQGMPNIIIKEVRYTIDDFNVRFGIRSVYSSIDLNNRLNAEGDYDYTFDIYEAEGDPDYVSNWLLDVGRELSLIGCEFPKELTFSFPDGNASASRPDGKALSFDDIVELVKDAIGD